MTVHELIKNLLKYDLEAEIKILYDSKAGSSDIISIIEQNKTIFICDEEQ